MRAADRRATANADLRPLGGSDWRFTYAAPGNLMAFDPVSGSYEPVYAIPRNQNGVGLPPGDFRPGEVNLTNQMEGLWSLPHQRRHSLFVAGRQDLPGGFSLDGDLRYTDRTYIQESVADIGILFVTPDNPFFVPVAGEPYQEIAYSFINDLGPGRDEGFSRSVGGAVGVTGELAGWNLAAYLSGGRETTGLMASNRVQTTRLDEALGSTPNNPGTTFNPAVDGYFNPYGDPAAHSPALLAFIGSGYYGNAVAAHLDFLRDYLLGGALAEAGLIDPGLEDRLTRDALLWRGGHSHLLSLALTEAWVRRWRERLDHRNP